MRLQDDIDFTTLTWVKQELDDTLKQAQQALEAFVEDSSDKSQMRFCASYLHQVQGTLRMVELYGAAMVVEEMERLALGLLDGQIKQAEDAYTVLMRGMVQLPDYLERLQSGHRDIPIVLLPLLNDLRACRGEKLLSETALFSPDLSAALPASANGAKLPTPQPLMSANGGRLRLAFQFGLLKWFKGEDIDGNLTRLIAAIDRLRSMCVQLDARRLFWVAGGVLEAVLVKGVEASVALKLLIGRVDREIKRLIDGGEAAFSAQPPNELTKGLLYYVAQSSASSQRVAELKQVYRLDKLIPSQAELEHARGALSGHNRALLDTVGTAIKEDLLRIKDAFDLHLRTGSSNVEELAPQGDALHRVADTLGMLGLGVPRRVVLDQKEVLERIVQGRQAAEESTLLDIAGSLLYVESSLDDHIERLGAEQKQESVPSSGFELPQAEVRKILDATTKEASANIQQAKQDIVAFIESPWDHSKIEQIPRLLEEISGAMRMLNLPEPAELLTGVVRFAEVELLKHRRVPSGDQLDLMADAIASIEFYLEAVKEGRRNRDRILDVTRRSLEALGYWPLPADGAEMAPEVAEIADTAPAANDFPTFPDTFATDRLETSSELPAPDLPAAQADVAESVGLPDAATIDSMISGSSEVVDLSFDAPLEIDPSSPVEIAPGDGLESLIIGEAAPATEPASVDLDGLNVTAAEVQAPSVSSTLTEFDSLDFATDVQFAESIRSETALDLDDLIADVAPRDSVDIDLSTSGDQVIGIEPLAEAVDESQNIPEVGREPETLSESLREGFEAPVFEPAPIAEPIALEPPVIEPVPSVSAPVPRVEPAPMPGFALPDVGFHSVPSDEIDDEIREVFVEEVQDELDNLNRQYPLWKSDLGDLEKLKPVRRSFHTLKGSGRLVGALAIGEFAWKIENMLNRILDKTIHPTPAALDLLDNAIGSLPGMLAALKGEGQPNSNLGTIMWVADQLATGQEVWLPKSSPAPVVTADEPTAAAGAEIELAVVESTGVQNTSWSDSVTRSDEVGVGAVEAADIPTPGVVELIDNVQVDVPEHSGGDALVSPAAGSPLDVDPLLMDILSSEVTAHVATIRRYLKHSESAVVPQPVSEELLRAVHTLNGALSMVDLPVLTRFVGPLEGYLKRLRAQGREPSDEGLQALHDAAVCIEQTMLAIEAQTPVSSTEYLAERVIALRDDLPAPDHPYHGYGIHELDEQHAPEPEPVKPWYEADETLEVAELGVDLALNPVEEGAVDISAIQDALPAADLALTLDVAGPDVDSIREEPMPVADAAWIEPEATVGESLKDLAAEERTHADTPDVSHQSEAIERAGRDLEDRQDELATDWLEISGEDLPVVSYASELPVVSDASEKADPIMADETVALVFDASDLERSSVEADLELEPTDLDFLQDIDGSATSPTADESSLAALLDLATPDASEPLAQIDLEATEPGLDVSLAHSLEDLGILDELASSNADDRPAMVLQASEGIESSNVNGEVTANEEAIAVSDLRASAEAELDRWLSDSSFDAAEQSMADEIGELIVSGQLQDTREDAVSLDDVLAIETVVDDVEPMPVAALDSPISTIDVEDSTPEEEAAAALENVAVREPEVGSFAQPTDEEPLVVGEMREELSIAEAMPEEPSSSQQYVHSDDVSTPVLEQTAASNAVVLEAAAPVDAGSSGVDLDPPGALDLPDMDLELLDIFVEEGVDILDHADGMMAKLRENPSDRETVSSLQRDLHTLKGGARMAGLTPIGDLSHAMESLFEAIVQGERQASRPAIESLERAFDRLHGMVQRVRARQAIGLPEQIIARIELVLEGREAELIAAPVETGPVSEAPEPVEIATPTAPESAPERVAPAPAPRTQRKTQLDEDEASARAAQQELIRVRADLLDNLVNFAGEVSIYRSRLEAQMGGFRFNLVEFEQTVLRLREQLRKLEMETEAQILSRFQRESEQSGGTQFDPLELDRFSTLQQLSRALAESVSDLVSIQNLLDDIARQSETLLLQQSRVSSDLQEGLMRTRMVPFESLVPRLRRILRQTAAELGKKAQLKVEGTQGEMDRTVLERMTAPFEHMLRNSLAHGIELPDVRRVRGKSEEGAVSIRVSREATEVLIQVTDDGAGMNRDAIRRKAIERGLMNPDAQLSDRDIYQFVLEAGFSTAAEVSKVAGRGVGMDVVASEVKQLGGSLEMDSDPGNGTRITIRLPFTLAVAQAVLVRLGESSYAIPMTSITGVTRMPRKEMDRRLEQKQLEIIYGGESYQIYDLGDLLRSPVNHSTDETQVPLLMSRTGDQRAAIRVSQVIGSKEVVVKSAGVQLSSVPGIFGATIMGDGRVLVILDLAPLVRHGVALRQAPELAAELDLLEPLPEPTMRRQPLVMVVDDSITMRKVTTRVLERADFDVFTAKDGLDAVEQLQDRMPDVILLDIEMPRMDGYEVATYIRNDQRLKHIPIIMITSRTGDKHRQRAMEIGVDRYLGKPYQENDLLKNVQEALTAGHAHVH